VRTWHVVVPIAGARGDDALLARAAGWYEARGGEFPDTPYARVARAAVDAIFRRAGLVDVPMPALEWFMPSFAEEIGLPSWFEALDIVLSEARAGGALAEVEEAAETLASAACRDRTRPAARR